MAKIHPRVGNYRQNHQLPGIGHSKENLPDSRLQEEIMRTDKSGGSIQTKDEVKIKLSQGLELSQLSVEMNVETRHGRKE